MSGPDDMPSRRFFLRQASLVALAGPAPLAIGEVAPAKPHAATADYQPSYFTKTEWNFLLAACARLIPADELGPGAVEAGVPQFIDRQMGTPWAEGAIWYLQGPFIKSKPEFGAQSALTPKQSYRLGIQAIDALCQGKFGRAFATLTDAQQDSLLHEIETGQLAVPELSLAAFFALLLRNTMEGFFGDPLYGGNKDMAGWKLIGHPGARADYGEYVGAAKPYPFGPVSLYGRHS